MFQKTLSTTLGIAALLGAGAPVTQAQSYSSCTNPYQSGVATPTGYGSAYGGTGQASSQTSNNTNSNAPSGNVQAVAFSDISNNGTISATVGEILDFTSGNSNVGSSVVSSSNASVISVLNSTQVQAKAAGRAVVTVNLYSSTGNGQMGSPTAHYVTVNVQ